MATEVYTSPEGIESVTGALPLPVRRSFGKIPSVLDIPRLVQIQLDSFQWFV